ncbi:NHL repeat-containing protein 2 [Durusdinium trenchii]|uniref:NHL repeat-containing protein 2 n=1 Tax=Durusdinium trenchii TaxID=1381693 RepID=A0ABP0M5X3_9DINO
MIHHVTIRSVTDWAWFQRGVSTRGPRDVSSRYVLPPLPAITTVAGTGVGALPSPEDLTTAQSATASTLRTPSGLVLDVASQLLYIADTENGRVRRLDLGAGTIRTIAGGATTDEVTDGLDAASRKLFRPMGLALDITRALLYVTDFHLNQLRRIDLSSHILTGGTITSVTGAALGAGFELRLRNPMGLVLDSSTQLLYVADAGQARLRVVNPLESCSAELPPQSTLQPCSELSKEQRKRPPAGCCYESNCGLPPNPDGRDTPGFQPEDVLTRVDGAKLDPPISFVNSGGQQCCHPNLRAMSTLDVTPWPQGLALDSGTNMRPGFEGRVILRFLLFFYGFYSGEVALVALMAFGFCG